MKGDAMKKIYFLLLIFIFGFLRVVVFAQEYKEGQTIELPPGMELIQIGENVFQVVPEGTKMRKEGSRVIIERTNAYMTRRFLDIEERLRQLEKQQEELKREIKELRMQIRHK